LVFSGAIAKQVTAQAPASVRARADREDGTGEPPFEVWDRIYKVRDIRRNSYRVERLSEDHAVHKVHLDGLIEWQQDAPPMRRVLRWFRHEDRMIVHFVYEFVFQRFADPQTFVLRELRVIASYGRSLSEPEVSAFRQLVVEYFVNDLVESEGQPISLDGEARDAVVALRDPHPAGSYRSPYLSLRHLASRWGMFTSVGAGALFGALNALEEWIRTPVVLSLLPILVIVAVAQSSYRSSKVR
jgi:hypothetical protein